MLLRKYFVGARIVGVSQIGFDRIADFSVSCYDEMGFAVTKHIICEIMGKYANLIVTDADMKVLAALKIIDFAASTVRQVLPGLKYQIPEQQEKLSPLDIDRALFFEKLAEFPSGRTGEKFITQTYSGIATQIAHELVYRASGAVDTPVCNIDPETFFDIFSSWQRLLIEEKYSPTAVYSEGAPMDYSYMDITYLDGVGEKPAYASLRELFDAYFADKDRTERIRQRAKDLLRLLSSAKQRTEKKLVVQRESLLDSERGEEYKKQGDLITANLYRLERGVTSFKTVDYYDENCPEIEISLNPMLSPSQNAQKAYKLYNKCKTAKEVLTEQIKIWEAELDYLDSVSSFLARAECEQDLIEIREELYTSGYASRLRGYKPQKQIKSRPMEFRTSGGYRLLVGRNNIQNDRLTFKTAEKRDVWFHTKDIPGSHVIMITEGEEPSERDYTEAAEAAAYFSQATGDLVAVDYTEVKNVKKPQGAKPGFVIYKTNYTAFVKPKAPKEN